jgi:uncharacterized metal-binding protein
MSLLAAGACSYVLFRAGADPEAIRLVAYGCIAGTIFSPDLDVDSGFLGHKWVERYFGKIVATAWVVIWWPYANFVPHRSWVSHAPVISTMLRAIYWYAFYAAVCILLGAQPYIPSVFVATHVLGGLMVSDILHYLTDIITTYFKRRQNASVRFPMSEMRGKNNGRARNARSASKKA